VVSHLGFTIDLQEGKLKISPQKAKSIRKELGKFATKDFMAKRQVAAILGQIRANLLALLFLRAFTTKLVNFLAQKSQDPWESKHRLSQDIKEELLQLKDLLKDWSGRPFVEKETRILYSDSSDYAWGGLDLVTGKKVQEYWRSESEQHINLKEMKAAISTVQSLSQPNEDVLFRVDNQVIFHYLRKRGRRKNPFNTLLQPFFLWLLKNNVRLQVQWVPSENCLADPLSRWGQDRGDYSLDKTLFHKIRKFFQKFITLETDLFASPGNKKLEKFVSRWPHWQAAAVDALQCSLAASSGECETPPGQ